MRGVRGTFPAYGSVSSPAFAKRVLAYEVSGPGLFDPGQPHHLTSLPMAERYAYLAPSFQPPKALDWRVN